MLIEMTSLAGPVLITPQRHHDDRGHLAETWSPPALAARGLCLPPFVQENESLSHAAGTLRGLHAQAPPHAQGKLVRCVAGCLRDVIVDIRRGSSGFGRWFVVELSPACGRQLWVPPGFLHGFVTLLPGTVALYRLTAAHAPRAELRVRWNSLPIDWGCPAPKLSPADAAAPPFADFATPFA
ncbi:MAG: dTDP-4-dehydrorhamnose 3,5-epimerase family protein [Rhodobacteraceae bacterium]|nr:dTDP-4-dehydrorhamnose 3,5-epimerase family protein [Paracoccaceae bacterium]